MYRGIIWSILLWACGVSMLQAQGFEGFTGQENLNQISEFGPNSPGGRGFDLRYEGVKGTPFMTETWYPGKLVMRDGRNFEGGFEIRLEAEAQELHVRFASGRVKVLFNEEVESFALQEDGRWRWFVQVEAGKIELAYSKARYYEVLAVGTRSVIKLYWKYMVKADYEQPYSSGQRADEFRLREIYYMQDRAGLYKVIKPKAKSISKVWPEKRKEIYAFFKEHQQLEGDKTLVQLMQTIDPQ